MPTSTALSHRVVESKDPSLSDQANRLLTQALRSVIGKDEVDVPADRPDHAGERHATHFGIVASAIGVRMVWGYVGLILALTALIAGIGTTSNYVLVGLAALLLLPATALVAEMVFRLFDEKEHLDPETSAILSEEGVGDPDRTFTDLVHDFETR